MFQKCDHCGFRNECAKRINRLCEKGELHIDASKQPHDVGGPSMDIARRVIAQCTDLDDLIYDPHDGQPSTK